MFKLRELEKKDLPNINVWRNDPDLTAYLGAPDRFINLDVDTEWYESYMANRSNTIRCAIVEDGNDDILGLISLVSIDHFNQSAELHIMIGNVENQGKGVGTFAVKKMLNHAFNNLNLRRIELTVLDSNIRAQRLYEKCGFIKEGTKRKAKFKNGVFSDMHIYSIIKEDYHK